MRLKLITPERTLFEGEVASVAGCAPEGDFEILENHGAWVSPLGICAFTARMSELRESGPDVPARMSELRESGPDVPARAGEEELVFAVHGGLIEVQGDSVLVLGDIAEAAEEIDRARAESALRRAKAEVAVAAPGDEDYELARRAMARAEARLAALTVKR